MAVGGEEIDEDMKEYLKDEEFMKAEQKQVNRKITGYYLR